MRARGAAARAHALGEDHRRGRNLPHLPYAAEPAVRPVVAADAGGPPGLHRLPCAPERAARTRSDAVGRGRRDRIAAAGYGAHFIHRTGRGIGLETHGEPYIVAGGARPLEPGMVFSSEPGSHPPGRFGARSEDIDVSTEGEDIDVCAEDGGERLNLTARALVVLSG